jgi:alkylation response protein AidB-like acyl-CoA dehydrogenase
MSIAITDDHRALADTAADFLTKRDARGAARALLEEPDEGLPPFWDDLVGLGWLGLHVPEDEGGSGYGLEELVVVVEAVGRSVAPGPFVPTVIASAVLTAVGGEAADELLPGLADGSVRVTVRVSKVLPKRCPSDRPSFEGPPEGLSATPSRGLYDRLPEGCPRGR